MSNSIKLTLPDGAVREVEAGTSALGLAESIGPGLAKAALASGFAFGFVYTSKTGVSPMAGIFGGTAGGTRRGDKVVSAVVAGTPP